MNSKIEKLDELITAGLKTDRSSYPKWRTLTAAWLESKFSAKAALRFQDLAPQGLFIWKESRAAQVGFLEGLAAKVNDLESPEATTSAPRDPKKVFLIHGRDSGTKETVARFLEKIGLFPIILHEQPNGGRTIIEKFERHADVGFAVALLTPDDVGSAKHSSSGVIPRARQNVILELGYFIGKLGRNSTCALYSDGVEMPSDLHGVLYVELDGHGAWHVQLAQELVNAGYQISAERLVS